MHKKVEQQINVSVSLSPTSLISRLKNRFLFKRKVPLCRSGPCINPVCWVVLAGPVGAEHFPRALRCWYTLLEQLQVGSQVCVIMLCCFCLLPLFGLKWALALCLGKHCTNLAGKPEYLDRAPPILWRRREHKQ